MSNLPAISATFLLPGARQILRGRVVTGGFVLTLWLGFAWILFVRWDRVSAAAFGPWDHKLALFTLVLGILSIWIWSLLNERGAVEGRSVGSHGVWALAWSAFRKSRVAVGAAITVGLFYLLALLTPFLAPFDPSAQGSLLSERMLGPSILHPFGTDQFSRDVLSRLLYGARISLTIGFVAVSISITIGTLLGAISGFVGGKIDAVLMRFVDMVISFPRLVLLIAIIAFFEPSIFLIVAVLGLTQWPQPTRLVRGEILSLREREFIQAGHALGFSRSRLVLRHLIPNALAPLIVAATLGIGDTIVLEAGLSFLGLGVQPPTPSWGTMVADGRDNLLGAWWISTFPGLAIVLVVLCFNLAGDGLRDALDPRLRS
jgi:peptide/nickel transport system permease protein